MKFIFPIFVILFCFSCNKKGNQHPAYSGPDYTSALRSTRVFHGIKRYNTLNAYDSVIASIKDTITDTPGNIIILSDTSINLFGLNLTYGSSDSSAQYIIFYGSDLTGNNITGFATMQLTYYYAKDTMYFYMSQLQGNSGIILSLQN